MGVDATIRLLDLRTLSFAVWGPEEGVPIFGFHGGGLSRLQHYGEEAPARAGVRLVLVDRPGSGRSDPHPGAELLDWPRDIAELADALGAGRFAVFGVSAGGPSALACGYSLGSRAAAVGLVSAVGPYVDEPPFSRTCGAMPASWSSSPFVTRTLLGLQRERSARKRPGCSRETPRGS